MSEAWSSQDDSDLGDLDAWMARRNAQLALRPEATNFARNLWNEATQSGDDLYAGNPSDLTAIGLAALGGATPPLAAADGDTQSGWASYPSLVTGGDRTSPATTGGGLWQEPIPASQNQANDPWVSQVDVIGGPHEQPHGFLESLNHSPIARAASGLAGYAVGVPLGALRSGWHALEGVGDGLNFGRSLFFSEGRAKAWNEAQTATHGALQYGRSVFADPSRLAGDALSAAEAANRNLNPLATPIPDTASGAFGHELSLGKNMGETLTNAAGLVALPEVVGGLNAARAFAATRDANVAKFLAQGFDEPTARYLSKPYEGQGDHAVIPRRQDSVGGIPIPLLKKARLPDGLMDSPLNVSKPRGMSQGDFYEYHYGVDPRFYGAKLPSELNGGKGWSGKRLGLDRTRGLEGAWARTPQIWKDYPAGVLSGEALGLLPQDTAEAPQ
jgi:hypothetical protein